MLGKSAQICMFRFVTQFRLFQLKFTNVTSKDEQELLYTIFLFINHAEIIRVSLINMFIKFRDLLYKHDLALGVRGFPSRRTGTLSYQNSGKVTLRKESFVDRTIGRFLIKTFQNLVPQRALFC